MIRAAFYVLVTVLRRWWVYLVVRRNPSAKCPACGNANGDIRWIPDFTIGQATERTGAIIHRCRICTAMWGEPPIVAMEHWHIEVDEGAFLQQKE